MRFPPRVPRGKSDASPFKAGEYLGQDRPPGRGKISIGRGNHEVMIHRKPPFRLAGTQ
jgi:hypothetical protein